MHFIIAFRVRTQDARKVHYSVNPQDKVRSYLLALQRLHSFSTPHCRSRSPHKTARCRETFWYLWDLRLLRNLN